MDMTMEDMIMDMTMDNSSIYNPTNIRYEDGTLSEVWCEEYNPDVVIATDTDNIIAIHAIIYSITDMMVYSYPHDNDNEIYVGDVVYVTVNELGYEPYNHDDDDDELIMVLKTAYNMYPIDDLYWKNRH